MTYAPNLQQQINSNQKYYEYQPFCIIIFAAWNRNKKNAMKTS